MATYKIRACPGCISGQHHAEAADDDDASTYCAIGCECQGTGIADRPHQDRHDPLWYVLDGEMPCRPATVDDGYRVSIEVPYRPE